ncbi:Crp/Fnr family transcriptional regulator [Henriciella sp. AS95]|uniref:Crp/Fnr family transcriptional regulator n=1 Tax=Henriciella sp. AS95 TaxID=3135782 RepID=UPI00317AD1A2
MDLLEDLEKSPTSFIKDDIIIRSETALDRLYVLTKGWVIAEKMSHADSRPIVHVFLPGDIIGFSELPFQKTSYQARSRTSGIMCPFPSSRLSRLFVESPRLARLIFAAVTIERAEQEDRASQFCRNNAAAKLALFVLQTLDRLKLLNSNLRDQFQCPLTQQEIGDLVGLSSVHVSRTFSQMEANGLIQRHKSFLKVKDYDSLAEMSDYRNRYGSLNLDWVPAHP